MFQSFLDEVAFAANADPVKFRLDILDAAIARQRSPTPPDFMFEPVRMRNVVTRAADMAGWAQHKKTDGMGLGIAFHFSHRGYFAQVAQVRVIDGTKLKVEKVWSAGDVGKHVINTSAAINQVQGAVIEAMTQVMTAEITIEGGRALQSNFHDYQLLRHAQAPAEIAVDFVKSEYPPTGLGEPALPPVVPAICNAIFAATGKRIRTLPLAKQGYSWA